MKKIFSISLAIFVCLLFSSPISFAATPSISSEVSSIKSTVPSSTPSAPSGMDEKGYVGSLLEKLFNSNSKIYWGHIDFNGFLSALGLNSVGNNQVPKWNSTTNTFQNSNIYSNGGNIGIGRSNPNYNLDVNGDINFTGDLYQNGSLFIWGKFKDGTNAQDAVYASTNVPWRNVGIGTDTPSQKLEVSGNIASGNIYAQDNIGRKYISGWNGANTGANMILYSSSHPTVSLRNSISFRSGTTSRIFIDGPTGNVWIATSNPTQRLQVNGNISTNSIYSQNDTGSKFISGGSNWNTGWNILFYAWNHPTTSVQNDVYIRSGSTNRMLVDGVTGNVGVGTTSPAQRLDVSGNIQSSGRGIFNDGVQIDGNTVIDNNAGWHRSYGDTGWYNQTYGGGIYMSDATWIRTYGGKKLFVNNDIISSENIGIGTTSPTQKLDVVGNASANNIVARNNTQWIIISWANNQNSGPNIALWGPSSSLVAARNDITFRTNTTSRMIIDGANGNVWIGTTSPSHRLQVNGDTQIWGRLWLGQNPLPWIRLSVNGHIRTPNQVRANVYCDENGNNCFDPQYGRMKCTVVNWSQWLELTSAERPDGNRYMMQPSAIPYRCRQLGYDTGFVRGMFGPQWGSNGWCGYGNARTAYRDTEDNMWRGESCSNGEAVHSAFCCSY